MADIKTIAELDCSSVLHPFTRLRNSPLVKQPIQLSSPGAKASASKTRKGAVTLTGLLAITV